MKNKNIRKWVSALLIISMITMLLPHYSESVQAAFGWAEERFDYPVGTKLHSTEAGNGWSSGWKSDPLMTADLDDSYFVSAYNGLEREGRVDMFRKLNTPIQLDRNQIYYLRWNMKVEGSIDHSGISRSRLKLSNNTFFGMQPDASSGNLLFGGRFLGQNLQGGPVNFGETYTILVKIVANATGPDHAHMKVYKANEKLTDEPLTHEWDMNWSVAGNEQFDTLGFEANIYSTGVLSFDELTMSARWSDIARNPSYGAIEDFNYPVGTLLSTTTADGGWSSGWKANKELITELDSSYVISLNESVVRPEKLLMYRGLLVPVDLRKTDDYYFKWKFSIDDPTNTVGNARISLDNSNFFGITNKGEGNTDFHFTARFLGKQQHGPTVVKGKEYTAVVKISAQTAVNDKFFMKIYNSSDFIGLEPEDWDIELEGASNAAFHMLGFESNIYKPGLIMLDHIYTGSTWFEVTGNRTFYMKDWFDGEVNSQLNETWASDGWSSGWRADAQLLTQLPSSYRISKDKNIRLSVTESVYRGIMPMSLDHNQTYYVSWKMGVDHVPAGLPQGDAGFYLDDSHYVTIQANPSSSNELQLFASFGGSEVSGPVVEQGKLYTIVAKLIANEEDADHILFKVYPEGHSAGVEPTVWDFSISVADTSTFHSIGFKSNLDIGSELTVDQLTLGTLWEEVNQSESRIIGEELFNRIDLNTNDRTNIRALVEEENYEAALTLYKDYFLEKIAEVELGALRYGFGHNGTADEVMDGIVTITNPPSDYTPLWIGEPGQIQWYFITPNTPHFSGALAEMDFTTLLTEEFIETGDVKYMKKWSDYWDDFARNNFHEWNVAINSPDRDLYRPLNDTWSSKLRLANRSDIFLQQLNLAAIADVEQLKQAINPTTLALSLNLIAERHLDRLVFIQSKPGGAPNQNLQVAVSLLRASLTMDEFINKIQWRETSDTILYDYVNDYDGVMMRDGSDLEQSFNYNGTLLEFANQLKDLYELANEDYDFSFIEKRLRFLASLIRPSGNMPGLAKMDNRPFFDKLSGWQADVNDETVQRILDHIYWESPMALPTKQPAFRSIYFPYGGFTIMRSGWDNQSYHLFMKSSRRGSGHIDESGNQIQLSAFGKTILVDSGPGSYSATESESRFNRYFEYSYSHNTVIVDQLTQLSYRTPGVTRGYSEPIDARWLTSDQFDFVEGTYRNGYGIGYEADEPSVTDVSHDRQVLYVKELGAFIVTDRMNANRSHEFTQIWNFDPEYKPNDVHVSNGKIYTTSATEPNIELHHFSAAHGEVEDSTGFYETYFDAINPTRGYYRHKTTEHTVPKVDVHMNWQGTGDQLLVTLINPMKQNTNDEYVEISNAYHGHISGFDAEKSGALISYRASLTKDEELIVGDLKITGEALLVTTKGDDISGIVLGAESWSVNGFEQELPSDSFEFKFNKQQTSWIEQGNKIPTTEIKVPTTFKWQETEQGLIPKYDDLETSLPEPTPSPGPIFTLLPGLANEINKTTQTIDVNDLTYAEQQGYTAAIRNGIDSVVLPLAVLNAIDGQPISLQKANGNAITLPPQLLAQLVGMAPATEQRDGSVVITFRELGEVAVQQWLDEVKDPSQANKRPAGGWIELAVAYVTKSGKAYALNEFESPLTLTLKLKAEVDVDLVGLYYKSDDGTINYTGTMVAGGLATAQISHPNTFGSLEMNAIFEDIIGHWAEKVIKKMAAKQIALGINPTVFSPNRQVTRAEFTTLIMRALGVQTEGENQFVDIPQDAWYSNAVSAAVEAGIVNGRSDQRFAPVEHITREEMAIMIVRAYEYKFGITVATAHSIMFADNEKIQPWAEDAVAVALELDLIRGRGNNQFIPQGNLTRAEAIQVISNLLEAGRHE